jgi:hypothetical protein
MDGLLMYMIFIFPLMLIFTVFLVLLFIELPMSIIKKFKTALHLRLKPKIWIAYLIVIVLFIVVSGLLIYDFNQPSQFIY